MNNEVSSMKLKEKLRVNQLKARYPKKDFGRYNFNSRPINNEYSSCAYQGVSVSKNQGHETGAVTESNLPQVTGTSREDKDGTESHNGV